MAVEGTVPVLGAAGAALAYSIQQKTASEKLVYNTGQFRLMERHTRRASNRATSQRVARNLSTDDILEKNSTYLRSGLLLANGKGHGRGVEGRSRTNQKGSGDSELHCQISPVAKRLREW